MKSAPTVKETGILFSAPMVRALLDGTKTQTRRVMKRQPIWSLTNPPRFSDTEPGDIFVCPDMFPTGDQRNSVLVECERIGTYHCMGQREFAAKHSPYGQPGDHIWVRETFFAYGRWETRYSEKKKRDEWHFVDMTLECDRAYQYAADNPDVPVAKGRGVTPGWYRRPAIFMPRAASRILLESVSVRVERLNDISEEDADAEGCERLDNEREERDWKLCDKCGGTRLHSALGCNGGVIFDVDCRECDTYAKRYRHLWESINGTGSWGANPFVWVITFKRITERDGE